MHSVNEEDMSLVQHDDQDMQIVKQWTQWLRRGAKKKQKFAETSREVDRFFEGSDHRHMYASKGVKEWMNQTGMIGQTVNLAFQIRGWLAPNLYHRNPTRTVTVRTKDPVLGGMAKVVEAYLNFTPNEVDLINESRTGIDESLLAGRGALFSGFDKETGLICSWSVSIDDILIDPDARKPEDALWIAFRRRAPLWAVKEQYKKTAKGLVADRVSEASIEDDEEGDLEQRREGEEEDDDIVHGATNDIVTVYEIYSKMGVGWRGRGVPEHFKHHDDSRRFLKIDLVLGHDRPLYVGKWDTRIHLDRGWPFSFLDLTPSRNRLWPVSLMSAGMGHQKSINLLATIWFEKTKVAARDFIGILKSLSKEIRKQIKSGGLFEVLELSAEDNVTDVRQAITRLEGGAISPEIEKQIRFHEDQFAQTTGLLPILKGLTNEQQVRSATEADIKDKNARSRLTDLSERVEDWQTKAARAEGILVRLELRSEEVARIVGDLELGWLVSWTHLGVEIPIRAKRREEDEDAIEVFDLDSIFPPAAKYFEKQEEAVMAAQKLVAALPAISNARMTDGLSPFFPVDVDGRPTVTVRKVTVEDVWRDTAYLSAEDLARELSYRVEAGSTKRPDPNKMIDFANTLMERVGAPAMQAGDMKTYNSVLKRIFEALQIPEAMRIYMPEQPPGAPPGPGGPPQGAPAQQPQLQGAAS